MARPFLGDAHMRPEELEDLWHLFNLISRGDHLRAKTLRKVVAELDGDGVSSQRVLMLLEIEVQSVDFDPEGGEMRVGGVTVSEHDGMSLGSHHTLELELQREFNLHKKCWDARHLEVLAQATGGAVARADVAAVLMEHGRCNVCLISGGLTVVRAKLEVHIPKKGAATVMQGAAKSTEKFYGQVLRAVLEHVDFAKVKAVLLAGPGFVKEQWWEWAKAEASKKRDHAEHKALLHSVPQWVLCHASSAYKHALKEVLGAPEVAARLSDTKAAAEVVALRRFFEMMADEPDRTTYGSRRCSARATRARSTSCSSPTRSSARSTSNGGSSTSSSPRRCATAAAPSTSSPPSTRAASSSSSPTSPRSSASRCAAQRRPGHSKRRRRGGDSSRL